MNDVSPQNPADVIAAGFVGVVEALRSDTREDLANLEERVTARIEQISVRQIETHDLLVDFAKGHAQVHEDEAIERRREHGIFHEFIRKSELDEARRDGALGVLRFGVELFSRNSGAIAKVLLAGAALWGMATGAISVGVKS